MIDREQEPPAGDVRLAQEPSEISPEEEAREVSRLEGELKMRRVEIAERKEELKRRDGEYERVSKTYFKKHVSREVKKTFSAGEKKLFKEEYPIILHSTLWPSTLLWMTCLG
ncbi:MAG: hypothetical protein IH897_15325 [Planctomycetes bacterium]|nr:hypothetical protein [Planctomycetota bacterium]